MCYQCDCVSCAFYVHDCSLVSRLTSDLQAKLTTYDDLLAENISLRNRLLASEHHYSILTIFFILLSFVVYELVLPWIVDKIVTRYAGERWASVMALCVAFSPLGILRLLGMLIMLIYDIVKTRNQRRHYTSLFPTPATRVAMAQSEDLETMPLTQALALRRCESDSSFHSTKSSSM